jgi:uncharacterized protein (TIGR00251 family)
MTETMLSIRTGKETVTFKIRVQPKSSRNAVAGLYGDALKIRVTAPPVGGAANAMCCQYLASCLGVPKSAVEIAAGATGRTKQVRIRCSSSETQNLSRAVRDLCRP